MFRVWRAQDGAEIRFDFAERPAEMVDRAEARAFMRLGPSLDAANGFLRALGADPDRSAGTAYQYAKALRYALEWLALEPVRIDTGAPVGHSLLTLGRADLRALFAWLAIPARRAEERLTLARTGELPPGYRAERLAASTHNLRHAALHGFYEYVAHERGLAADIVGPAANPLDGTRPPTAFAAARRPDGLLPRDPGRDDGPKRAFRRRDGAAGAGVVALWPAELRLVLDAVPLVFRERNAANRNGAMLRLLTYGLLRRAELAAATWEALDDRRLLVRGKGEKDRWVPLADEGTWAFLRAYTNDLRLPPERRYRGPLLRCLRGEGGPMTAIAIEEVLRALKAHFRALADEIRSRDPARALALDRLVAKLHPHVFRATGATFLAAGGLALVKLAALMGHTDPATTMRYYVAAEQLALTADVERICAGIAAALAVPDPAPAPEGSTDNLDWYRRRGLL